MESLRNALHNLWNYHREYTQDRFPDLQLGVCVPRIWYAPWLLNSERVGVWLMESNRETFTGTLTFEQLEKLLQSESITDMRIMLVSDGDGTCY